RVSCRRNAPARTAPRARSPRRSVRRELRSRARSSSAGCRSLHAFPAQPWLNVDEKVEGQPAQNHEIPVNRRAAHIEEALSRRRPAEEINEEQRILTAC